MPPIGGETLVRPAKGKPPRTKGDMLTESLAFYGAYHMNPWNQLIHFFCVPAIMWSLCVWLAQIGPLPLPPDLLAPAWQAAKPHIPAWLPAPWAAALVPNPAFLLVACYSLFYLFLEPVAGFTWTLFIGIPMAWSASVFAMFPPAAVTAHVPVWAAALVVHVLGWYLQIHPGHAICEGRKPALLDSLVQAFSLAPLFVWFELLFLLGYRPALQRRLKLRASQLLYDAKKGSKKAA